MGDHGAGQRKGLRSLYPGGGCIRFTNCTRALSRGAIGANPNTRNRPSDPRRKKIAPAFGVLWSTVEAVPRAASRRHYAGDEVSSEEIDVIHRKWFVGVSGDELWLGWREFARRRAEFIYDAYNYSHTGPHQPSAGHSGNGDATYSRATGPDSDAGDARYPAGNRRDSEPGASDAIKSIALGSDFRAWVA